LKSAARTVKSSIDMEPKELRSLLWSRGHSSISAAEALGCSAAQIRDWRIGRRPIPEKYVAAIERLPQRAPAGRRWAPADSLPDRVKGASSAVRVETSADPAPVRQRRRKAASKRSKGPLVREIDPVIYDERHPVRPVEGHDAEAVPLGGFLDQLAQAFAPALALINRGAPAAPPALDGEILPPLPAPALPAVIPLQPASVPTAGLPQLPAGIAYPRPAMIFDSVFPAALRGKACCAPLMVRHAGGMVAPAFCGETCEPGSDVCRAHLPRAAASPQLWTATMAPVRIKARRPVYY
jgi:hypothetical protein